MPAGAWEQDARVSAPDTLQAVCSALKLDEAPALLYLQTLTLLNPTKKNVVLWNDWKPAAYRNAAAVLVERELVLVGKRSRAGREHFLPGAWSEQKRLLPYEEWKRPLYGFDGRVFHMGAPRSAAPIHLLFERAWARYVSGDVPKFREVR